MENDLSALKADVDNLDWEKNFREEHGLKNSHHTLTVDDFDDENNFNTYYRVRADNSEAQITTDMKDRGDFTRTFTDNTFKLLREKSTNLKNMFGVKNTRHRKMNKHEKLHDKYLRLESKGVQIESENYSDQIEIKAIENENSSLKQEIQKLKLGDQIEIKAIEDENSNLKQEIQKLKLDQVEIKAIKDENSSLKQEIQKLKLVHRESELKLEITCFEKQLKEADLHEAKNETMRLKEKLSVNENKLQKANVEIEFHRMENHQKSLADKCINSKKVAVFLIFFVLQSLTINLK